MAKFAIRCLSSINILVTGCNVVVPNQENANTHKYMQIGKQWPLTLALLASLIMYKNESSSIDILFKIIDGQLVYLINFKESISSILFNIFVRSRLQMEKTPTSDYKNKSD